MEQKTKNEYQYVESLSGIKYRLKYFFNIMDRSTEEGMDVQRQNNEKYSYIGTINSILYNEDSEEIYNESLEKVLREIEEKFE